MSSSKYIYTIDNRKEDPYHILFYRGDDYTSFCREKNINPVRIREAAITGRPYKGYYVSRDLKTNLNNCNSEVSDKCSLTDSERFLRLTDENNRLKNEVKELTRESSLFKELSNVIESLPVITNIPEYIKPSKKGKIVENAILLLSDSHADQIITSERVQGLEDYNFKVACKRAERIVDTTITHLRDNLVGYEFECLNIFSLGDLVSGEIHGAIHHSQWQNSIKSSLAVGELFANMILDLSKYFPKINYIAVSGNHGRRSLKKDFKGAHENWDYLVAMTIKSRLQKLIDEGRLEVEIPNSWSAGVQIYGYNFVLNHGDCIKGLNGIPFYGVERKTRRLTSIGAVNNKIPNYYFFGHFHQGTSLTHTTGETFINGSWNSTDEFALDSMAGYSEPVQFLLGVHEKWGVTWRLPVRLRTKNWKEEELSESRYKISIK